MIEIFTSLPLEEQVNRLNQMLPKYFAEGGAGASLPKDEQSYVGAFASWSVRTAHELSGSLTIDNNRRIGIKELEDRLKKNHVVSTERIYELQLMGVNIADEVRGFARSHRPVKIGGIINE